MSHLKINFLFQKCFYLKDRNHTRSLLLLARPRLIPSFIPPYLFQNSLPYLIHSENMHYYYFLFINVPNQHKLLIKSYIHRHCIFDKYLKILHNRSTFLSIC